MARLRPRTKQFILAGAIGAVSVMIIAAAAIYWGYGYMSKERRQLEARYMAELNEARDIIDKYEASHTKVWLLGDSVDAGHELTSEDLVQAELLSEAVPHNAVSKEEAIGKITKIPLDANTLIVDSMIFEEGQTPPDLRNHEYGMLRLPQLLKPGEFVDVRISFPGGQDYIVLSKKKVQHLSEQTVWYQMNEEELLMMSSAIVDAYVNNAYLYAITYVDPYMQREAIVTYPANEIVMNLMKTNPNIVELASNELALRERKRLEEQLKEMSGAEAEGYKLFRSQHTVPSRGSNFAQEDVPEDGPSSTPSPTQPNLDDQAGRTNQANVSNEASSTNATKFPSVEKQEEDLLSSSQSSGRVIQESDIFSEGPDR